MTFRTSSTVQLAILCLIPSLCSFSAHAALDEKEVKALQLLVLGPKSNELKTCLDESFDILEGLVAVANAPEEKVLELLTRGEMPAKQRAIREQQAKMWKTSPSPAQLAQYQFDTCLTDRGMPPVKLDAVGESCFKLTTAPAYAWILKTGPKLSEADTLAKMQSAWNTKKPPEWLTKVVSGIYAAKDYEQKHQIYRQVFVGCVGTSETADKKD